MLQKVTPAYLVVSADTLMMMDIAEEIGVFAPGAPVLTAETAERAGELIAGIPALVQAFVAASPEEFEAGPLCRAIRDRGGAVVLLGDQAEEAARTVWPVLHRPFSAAAVRTHLRNPVRALRPCAGG